MFITEDLLYLIPQEITRTSSPKEEVDISQELVHKIVDYFEEDGILIDDDLYQALRIVTGKQIK